MLPAAAFAPLGEVVSHLFRKEKLGLKIAIKIPFFADVEFNIETEWEPYERAPAGSALTGRAA